MIIVLQWYEWSVCSLNELMMGELTNGQGISSSPAWIFISEISWCSVGFLPPPGRTLKCLGPILLPDCFMKWQQFLQELTRSLHVLCWRTCTLKRREDSGRSHSWGPQMQDVSSWVMQNSCETQARDVARIGPTGRYKLGQSSLSSYAKVG